MNDSMVDAARDLGANNFQVVKNIILPYLSPGIIAGYFMALPILLMILRLRFSSQEMALRRSQ